MPRILDLYSGMGGLSLGFALALRDAQITGLDIDEDAVATYNLNLSRFGARARVQDVLAWEPSGEYDIIVGGSPCQPFSIANSKNPGTDHPLFPTLSKYFDVVLALKPKLFLLENVKGLTTRRHRVFLERELARASRDYVIAWRVLNTADYGVPQRRERMIAIGVRRDLGLRPRHPAPTHSERPRVGLDGRRLHRWLTLGEAIGDLLAAVPAESPQEARLVVLRREQAEEIRRKRENPRLHGFWGRMDFPDRLDEPSRTISSFTVEGARRETIVVPAAPGGVSSIENNWSVKVVGLDRPAYTITTKSRLLVPVPGASPGVYRRLTVRECLRIQGFPDWWRFPAGVSLSEKHKLIGDVVPPVFAYKLAVAVAGILGLGTREPPREDEWALPYFRRAFAEYFSSA